MEVPIVYSEDDDTILYEDFQAVYGHVPRLIMQTWKTSDVPDKWKGSPESIKEHMKGWDYVLMTDKDNLEFVEKYFPDFLPTYLGYKYPIQRADSIRYMWLYINGGVYMDLDYRMNTSIEHLFDCGSGLYFMNSANFPQYWTNSVMASEKGNKFWLEVIERMKVLAANPPAWAKGKHFHVMETTGPGMLSKMIQETTYQYTVLPVRLISPRNICDKPGTRVGLMEPLEGCSWGGWDTITGNWIFCNCNRWYFYLIVVLIILFIIFIIWFIVSLFRGKKEVYYPPPSYYRPMYRPY